MVLELLFMVCSIVKTLVDNLLRGSVRVAEIHPDYTKVDGKRAVANPINDKLEIVVLYGAVSFGGLAFRVKTTLKLYHEPGHPRRGW